MRSNSQLSHAQDFIVGYRPYIQHRRKPSAFTPDCIFMIVYGRFAHFQCSLPFSACSYCSSADALECGDAARMIEVRMRIDDQSDVLSAEAQLANVLDYKRR